MALVTDDGAPLMRNAEVLALVDDDRLTTELTRFSLEANLSPVPLAGRPFTALGDEFAALHDRIADATATVGGSPVTIGILPTLTTSDLQASALSADVRYAALDRQLRRLRHQPFQLDIAGEDHLRVSCEHVTMEGANTSLQVHLRVDPEAYATTSNAAQLASMLLLGVVGNSPTFLGHRLWDETRVALFKQSVDPRGTARRGKRARVGFGTGWLDGSVLEEFRAGVEHFEPILPVLSDEDLAGFTMNGTIPELRELRLHHGTVWRWNRAVYDHAHGGHVRLELRCLPSGPTVADMTANVAGAVGLVLALRDRIEELTAALPFPDVEAAFYRTAREGPDAAVPWPDHTGAVVQRRVTEVVADLLPAAGDALRDAGVEAGEHLGLLAARASTGRTGARWQRRALVELRDEPEPLRAMLTRYRGNAATGAPVHTWA